MRLTVSDSRCDSCFDIHADIPCTFSALALYQIKSIYGIPPAPRPPVILVSVIKAVRKLHFRVSASGPPKEPQLLASPFRISTTRLKDLQDLLSVVLIAVQLYQSWRSKALQPVDPSSIPKCCRFGVIEQSRAAELSMCLQYLEWPRRQYRIDIAREIPDTFVTMAE